jgi:hypothetical protein
VASKVPRNSAVLAPTPEQRTSIQDLKSEAGEARGFLKNVLAPLIMALNVALPLLSILFLVITLRRMDRAAPGKEGA